MKSQDERKALGMKSPIAIPQNIDEAKKWQEANKHWWEFSPMRYDWKEKISFPMGTREYFLEIDKRFFKSANQYLPAEKRPFDRLINFDLLAKKDVLEIGVGHGSHAQLIAPHCQSYTGIDLTHTAAQMTQKRFQLFGINGKIVRMDAEKMDFADNSFDFIWSWGVIHHSSNTNSVLKEMHRVLRPGGEATIMVYHRSFWKYYVECAFVRGILQGQLFKGHSLNQILQYSTDGALARFYKNSELKLECENFFQADLSVCGQKSDLLLMPPGSLKDFLIKKIPDRLTSFFTNDLGWGTFLIAKLKKKN